MSAKLFDDNNHFWYKGCSPVIDIFHAPHYMLLMQHTFHVRSAHHETTLHRAGKDRLIFNRKLTDKWWLSIGLTYVNSTLIYLPTTLLQHVNPFLSILMTPDAIRVAVKLLAINFDTFAKQLILNWKFEIRVFSNLPSLWIRSIKCLRIRALALCYVGEQINAVLVCAERLSTLRRFLLGIGHCDLPCCRQRWKQ